jgi:putative tryptophan/tyrosine transport system substrate-binding protein
MDRRRFLLISLAGALAAPLAAVAQPAGRIYRIGWLGFGSPNMAVSEPFRRGLRDLGYVEGQNVVIEWRFPDARPERLSDLAAELVRLKVDVIVTPVTSTTQAAMQATRTIPIVMLAVPDPVGSGLVSSLARPGGNVTGLSFLNPELSAKQLQLLKEVRPAMSPVAILRDPAASGHAITLRAAEVAAVALGMRLQVVDAREPHEFDGAFAAMVRGAAAGLLVFAHPTFVRHRTRLAELAAQSRLPAMYGATVHAEAGGLMAYAPSLADNFTRGALFVDKILKGAKPGELPVEQPTKFEFVINLKTAKTFSGSCQAICF